MEQKVTVQDLENHYINHTLTDYLKTLDIEQLRKAYFEIMKDTIMGAREDIYSAICNEFEYRESEE